MRARPVAIVGRFAAIAWAATAWAATASAQPVDHEAAAYQLAADGKLDEALAEFALAYEAAPVPQLLFAMGRVHVMRGDCVRASDHFERFLATRPGPKAVDAARAEIARCEPAPVIVEPPPDPVPGPVTIEPAPMPRPQRASFASALVHDRFAQLGAVSGVVAAGAQQNKMKECNASAGELKGDERKAHMKECLSAKPANKGSTQQEKMKSCNKEAGEKALKGDDRKKFMSGCLKG